jgi:hypothetical protein
MASTRTLSLKITGGLRVFGGVNVTHARYTSFTDAVITVPFPVATGFSPASYTYLSSKTGTVVANTACLGTFGAPTAQLGGNCLLYGNASGNKLQNTPDVTFSLGGAWDAHPCWQVHAGGQLLLQWRLCRFARSARGAARLWLAGQLGHVAFAQ